jgi:hypothetical protein
MNGLDVDEEEEEVEEEEEEEEEYEEVDADVLSATLARLVEDRSRTDVCFGDVARELPMPVLLVDGTPVALPLRTDGPSADLVGRTATSC